MLKKSLTLVAAGIFATSALANDLFAPEDAVEYRQALYQVMAAQMSVMGGMAKGELAFDREEFRTRVGNLGKVAPMVPETYFPATSEVEDSRLSSEAWEDMEGFQEKGQAFGQALQQLTQAATAEDFDLAAARSQVGNLGKTCRGCHDDYRED
ncbi:c-type cytochrome [Marinospirillum perlucidum]|uniref:c-type cytochrome n=1 Tax=Marinospirillum perlucidum TaxID=1982602 RepID=UPI000DF48CB5|nr:cytochrome c [Marinospirillum perlucidum]